MESKLAIYGGDLRRLYQSGECKTCANRLWVRRPEIGKKSYCSQLCAAKAQMDYGQFVCAQCSKEFIRPRGKLRNSKSGFLFCSRVCKDKAQRMGGIQEIQPPHYGTGNGKHDYRLRALDFYGRKCGRNACPVTKILETLPELMLDVHHKDCNREHNSLENLEVLCVWCHALETRRKFWDGS